MWELIKSNQRKSLMIFLVMGFLLLSLGYLIGMNFYYPDGGIFGLLIALFIWIILSTISYYKGHSIIMSINNAVEISHHIHPQLFNIVEEMKIASSLPYMPKVYIIDNDAPNAFAAGTKPDNSCIAVTAGLLSLLNRDELQAVVAHEMAHIKNRDVMYLTFAGMMLGAISIMSDLYLRGMIYGGNRRTKVDRSSGGNAQVKIIMTIITMLFAILAPLLAKLFYFSLSRQREYLADAMAVRFTRFPEGLASALEKISKPVYNIELANNIAEPMFIVPPLAANRFASGLFSTHPPINERIKILRSLSTGVELKNYALAFQKVTKSNKALPNSFFDDKTNIPVKEIEPTTEATPTNPQRTFSDLINRLNNYIFLVCLCGLKIKIPPDLNKSEICCPKCGRDNKVPMAELATIASAGVIINNNKTELKEEIDTPKKIRQVYKRQNKGWESFQCNCSKYVHLSPNFNRNLVKCSECESDIEIINID